MPTYEYKCPECNTVTEEVHKISEQIVVVCPKCNMKKIKGVGGGLAFHFKCSGFYKTDYQQ